MAWHGEQNGRVAKFPWCKKYDKNRPRGAEILHCLTFCNQREVGGLQNSNTRMLILLKKGVAVVGY